MKPRSVKIFGERNTGTNALAKIIEENSCSVVLPGASAEEIDKYVKHKILAFNIATRPLKSYAFNWRTQRREKFEDAVFAKSPDTFAWKHSATNFKRIDTFKGCHILFCVRNPYSWMTSFFKNSYHVATRKPAKFMDFIDMDWVLVGRDNLPYDKLKPHQLYEKKLLSYLEFAGKLEKECISYQFINFERLIIEQESVFSDISSFLMSPSSNFEPLLNSTKDSFKTLAYYRDYYVKEQWRKGVECEIEKLAEMVNKDLHRNFGYLI